MLTMIGDILNWLAAGVVFPLMFLPLAALIEKGSKPNPLLDLRSAPVIWAGIVFMAAFCGLLFAYLTPVLALTPNPGALGVFAILTASLTIGIAFAGGAQASIDRLSPFFDRTVRTSARAVMWLLFAMAFVQFLVVVLRYVFGVNFIFMQESITYMHGAVFLLAAGYALIADGHVRVDIFYREAPEKRKALVDFLGTYFFLFPVCLLLLWTASPYVASSWAVREGSTETSGIQAVFLLKSLIPAFAVLLAMAGFNVAAKAGATLRGGR